VAREISAAVVKLGSFFPARISLRKLRLMPMRLANSACDKPAVSRWERRVSMPPLVAHSEQVDKPLVRHCRSDLFAGRGYARGMRLRIKTLRESRGWTVADLAAKVGMSRSYVSEIENHRKTCNSYRLELFAKAFGVSPVDLIDDGGDVELIEHVRRLRDLSDEDRRAVLRHAEMLAGSRDKAPG